MERRILYIFTRTPLHVGAGSSVGAIDQPVVRERHTGFPIIPASSLKGAFADAWNDDLQNRGYKRVVSRGKDSQGNEEWDAQTDAAWLFGSDDAGLSFAGALQFTEARLLAFPIRSARGTFAWITSPLLLRRALRDGALPLDLSDVPRPSDGQALFLSNGPLAVDDNVVLEEYTFRHAGDPPQGLGDTLADLLPDPVWKEITARLVILSDGMASYFARNACEIAQHIRINDETGTVARGALFNQENVPSETLFYALIHAHAERTPSRENRREAQDALAAFGETVTAKHVFQFGGDASTGLGYCTVEIADPKGA